MVKISKKRYLQGFCIVVLILAIYRTVHPEVGANVGALESHPTPAITDSLSAADTTRIDSINTASAPTNDSPSPAVAYTGKSIFFDRQGKEVKHRILGVYNYGKSFPDENDIQLIAAEKNGVKPVANRTEAEKRKADLVYVGSNPYFHIDRMRSSIPYLVPKASMLLQDIGRAFFDSLRIKGVPLHKIIVTSVLRTDEDVAKLQRHNQNAKTNSCHRYGTTFDIAQNRFKTIEDPNGPKRRVVRNDTLKWVLSEVLDDIRQQNRCYIKYEIHQGCFHVTVR
jgi:hypothetical protein